jgi:hypothetical protein
VSAIDEVLVPGCRALAPVVFRNGGTTVYKSGYHGPRDWMRRNYPNDYSIQHAKDQKGPGDKGSAFDWTFDDARLRSDFSTIAKFSRRLYVAGQTKDPRAYPLREFQGNIDSDRTVEGWSFYRERAITTSDTSHLWHIHFSVWRQYINDAAAMRSVLSILRGEDDDMPSLEEIADKLARDTEFLNGVAQAILDRDGVPNLLNDPDNPNVRVDNALAEIRRDARQTKAAVAVILEKLS